MCFRLAAASVTDVYHMMRGNQGNQEIKVLHGESKGMICIFTFKSLRAAEVCALSRGLAVHASVVHAEEIHSITKAITGVLS